MSISVHAIIYKTLDLTNEEVMDILGSGSLDSVINRRDLMRSFLSQHEWNELEYKKWLSSGRYKPTGLGDTIAKITSAVGVKPCGGCKKRQAKLNQLFPYKVK